MIFIIFVEKHSVILFPVSDLILTSVTHAMCYVRY